MVSLIIPESTKGNAPKHSVVSYAMELQRGPHSLVAAMLKESRETPQRNYKCMPCLIDLINRVSVYIYKLHAYTSTLS